MISVKSIHKKEQARIKQHKQLYRRVVMDCSDKIQRQVKLHQNSLFYRVPIFIFGVPLYNVSHIVKILMKELKKKQFDCVHLGGNIIYIMWASVVDSNVMKTQDDEPTTKLSQENQFETLMFLSDKYKKK